MGISINLYRTPPAESPYDIDDLKNVLESPTIEKVNLYKMTEDLAVIFHDNPEPFNDVETLPYIMLFGAINWQIADIPQIGGFTPTSIVEMVNEWIVENNVLSWEGFQKIYDSLSVESKNQLVDIGSPTKEELYEGYVKPLAEFYSKAHRDNNSIIICGE
jgi:hypothetical protein